MAQPIEKMNDRHRRELLEQDELWAQERRRQERERERKREAEPAPVDWAVVDQLVRAAIVVERERAGEILAHLIAEMRDEQAEAIERATEALRAELKVAIAKSAVAADCVVRGPDGTPDIFASMRKNRTQFRNAMRSAEAAASASEGMIIDLNASDGLNFGSPKHSVN
jgi:hypothetical protein